MWLADDSEQQAKATECGRLRPVSGRPMLSWWSGQCMRTSLCPVADGRMPLVGMSEHAAVASWRAAKQMWRARAAGKAWQWLVSAVSAAVGHTSLVICARLSVPAVSTLMATSWPRYVP